MPFPGPLPPLASRRAAVRRALIAGLLGAAAIPATAPAAAGEIAPHRAIYELDLASARASSQVADIGGRMMFAWEDGCDGWTIEQRYLMTFLYAQGPELERQITYTSWESKDGTRFTFNYRATSGGRVDEEYRGSAELGAPGGSGTMTYRLPEPREEPLPDGTWFPTSHTVEMIAQAEEGVPFFAANLFDGSGENGLAFVNAFIGDRLASGDGDAAVESPLLDQPSWATQMTFFSLPGDAATPDYEMAVDLYANGIVADMMIDYGDFILSAELTELEPLEAPKCD